MGQSISPDQIAGLAALLGAGMRWGDQVRYDASNTKTLATEWAPPTGYELWGWEVVCIGAGGGGATGNSANGGTGGQRIKRIVPRSWLAAALTVTLTVGAGSMGAQGGRTTFGAFVAANGGQSGTSGKVVPHPDQAPLIFQFQSEYNETLVYVEGGVDASKQLKDGFASPSGNMGGGGATAIAGGLGGAVYPVAVNLDYYGWTLGLNNSPMNLVSNLSCNNPSTNSGDAGHAGVGDFPGGGGNENYTGGPNSGRGGEGGFPGGGGGATRLSNINFASRGGHGCIFVTPIFRKTV